MMTPEQLLTQIERHHHLPSVILCAGDEPMRIIQTVDALKERAKMLGYLEQQLVVIEQASDWETLWLHYQEQSLFANLRVIQVIFSKLATEQAKTLLRMIQQPNPDVLLILRSDELDKSRLNSAWVKYIDQHGWLIHSKAINGNALAQWVQQQAQALQLTLTPAALSLLVEWSEGNLLASRQSLLRWQLQGLTQIDADVLMADQQDWAKYDVFSLSNSLSQQKVEQSLRILARLKLSGEEPVLILWVLSRELRLWQTLFSAYQHTPWPRLVQEHRLWTAQAGQLQTVMKQLTAARLKHWQASCLTLDLMLKGQLEGDVWAKLMWLVADMASSGRRLIAA